MKKIFYFLTLTFMSVLVSCSNDSEIIIENVSRDQTHDYISIEELFQEDSVIFRGWESSSKESFTPKTRSSVNTITLYGYTSLLSTGNRKVILGSQLAGLMGITNQIYIAENITAYQNIRIEGLNDNTSFFATVTSPLCGIDPNSTNFERGYSASSADPDGNIRLASKCVHVISDLSGRSYDLWYPCRPSEFQWIYRLINITDN